MIHYQKLFSHYDGEVQRIILFSFFFLIIINYKFCFKRLALSDGDVSNKGFREKIISFQINMVLTNVIKEYLLFLR